MSVVGTLPLQRSTIRGDSHISKFKNQIKLCNLYTIQIEY
jgi:hypothetical protein